LHQAQSSTGKQWHEPKSAFRPKAGNSTYKKRTEERKAMATVKAKEREMKEEKEAERQVCYFPSNKFLPRDMSRLLYGGKVTDTLIIEENTTTQRQTSRQGGEGTVREAGRDNASKTSREAEEKGKAKQTLEIMKE
jgi:hypothetical protein